MCTVVLKEEVPGNYFASPSSTGWSRGEWRDFLRTRKYMANTSCKVSVCCGHRDKPSCDHWHDSYCRQTRSHDHPLTWLHLQTYQITRPKAQKQRSKIYYITTLKRFCTRYTMHSEKTPYKDRTPLHTFLWIRHTSVKSQVNFTLWKENTSLRRTFPCF